MQMTLNPHPFTYKNYKKSQNVVSSSSNCLNVYAIKSHSFFKFREYCTSPFYESSPLVFTNKKGSCQSILSSQEDCNFGEFDSIMSENAEANYLRRVQKDDLKAIFDLNLSELEVDIKSKPYFKIKESLKFLNDVINNASQINHENWNSYIKLRLKKILNKKKGSVSLQQILPICESLGLIDQIFEEVSLYY